MDISGGVVSADSGLGEVLKRTDIPEAILVPLIS